MGRVKSTAIKKTAKKLFEEHNELFTEKFEENKLRVQELVECDKKTRNKIAGYITRLKNKKSY
ncbi:MAG: 30S ribosomal protein S17e [Candidatus Pacearchaeota archaeon]